MDILTGRLRRRACLAVVLITLLPPSTASVTAQGVTAATLKAAFLYNFAKFAEWPADVLPPMEALSLCVLGDDSVGEALRNTTRGRQLDSHVLTVKVVGTDAVLLSCHLLYISGIDATRTKRLLDSLKNAPIFTVSDADRFAEMGGVAQIIVKGGHITFAVNLGAANRAHLKISSKLLSLATIVMNRSDTKL